MNTDNSYPHPVLGNSEDIDHNTFILNLRHKSINGKIQYDAQINIGEFNEEYEEMIKENKAKYVILVHCQQTFYRKYFDSLDKSLKFDIDHEYLRGVVEFTGHIIAAEEITNYSLSNQNEDFFSDEVFDISPGDLLGISNTVKQFVEPPFNQQDNSRRKPILTIVEGKNIRQNFNVVKWGDDQLRIGLPPAIYKEFSRVKQDRYLYIHHSSFFVPVLAEAISRVTALNLYNEFEEQKWYFVIEQALEYYEVDPNLEPFVQAQILLKKPLKKFIGQLVQIEESMDVIDE